MSLAGFLLVISSAVGSHIESVPVSNQLGLLQMVPPLYWLGIGTMALALVLGMRSPNHLVFFAQAAFLYLAIWGTPAFFESYASGWDVYLHYYSAQNIVRIGHIDPQFSFTYENNYPGLFMLIAAFNVLAQPDAFSFLRFYPLFSSALTLLSIYLFTRTYVPGLDHRLSFVLAMMADVWVQVAFSPQSIGLAVGLFVFVFLEKSGRKWQFLALASFSFLVISHPTTTILVMGGLVSREIFIRIRKLWRRHSTEVKERRVWIVSAMAIVWVLWLLTAANTYFQFLLTDIGNRIEYLLKVSDTVSGAVGLRTGGNLWLYAPYIRLATVGVFTLMALFALFLGVRRRFHGEKVPISCLVLFLFAFLFIVLDILLLNSQLYDRGIMLLILSASVILAFGFRYVKAIKPVHVVAIAIAFIMAGTCWSTVFYQEGLVAVSQESVDASHFITERLPPGFTVIGGHLVMPVWEGGVREFEPVPYYLYYNQTQHDLARVGIPSVAVFDKVSLLWSTQYSGLFYYNFYLTNATFNSQVYDNGNYQVVYGWNVP
jgi:hypothetical protein